MSFTKLPDPWDTEQYYWGSQKSWYIWSNNEGFGTFDFLNDFVIKSWLDSSYSVVDPLNPFLYGRFYRNILYFEGTSTEKGLKFWYFKKKFKKHFFQKWTPRTLLTFFWYPTLIFLLHIVFYTPYRGPKKRFYWSKQKKIYIIKFIH